ncbi:hypothetical protein HRI_000791800 [Hibiscus trionum]|uniref:Uncharacterized protein n=1 Tax=Hibiscus trionum TaxID=183268 RepID=A0A9W7LPZ8_HIBTR|nr:hypothetical protein HRI_000791800 [Hibiscus trionum]
MVAALKLMCVMGLIVLVSILEIGNVDAAGECGKSSPDNEAMKLAPSSGIKLENAITIPKRCNFANRPVGYKCGPYTLP